MGRRGQRSRKPHQHLPKVGTATEREQELERGAVLGNMGLGGIGPGLKVAIGIVAALVVLAAVVALVALN